MVIAITGGDRSGKTTLAEKLSNDLGWPVRSFAEPLKEAARILFGYDDSFKDTIHPDFGKTHRDLIIELATHLRSTYRDDFFARLMPIFGNFIIDDLRFLVEYEHIKNENILVISVGDKVTEVQKSNVEKSPFLLMEDYAKFLELIKEKYVLRREFLHTPSFNYVYASNKSEATLYSKYLGEGKLSEINYWTPCRKVDTQITDGNSEEKFIAFIPIWIATQEYLEIIKPGWRVIE